MKNKKKEMLLIGLGIVSILVVIIGVTYAFFNYTKQGSTNNVIETGTIKFLYDEKYGYGNGIQIIDAVPMSDTMGKAQKGNNQVFDFRIVSTTMSNTAIPYTITVKKYDSELNDKFIKLYLTKVEGENEEELVLSKFNGEIGEDYLDSYKGSTVEKILYEGRVPSNRTDYEINYRLRMWIDESIDFSPEKDGNGNSISGESSYNGQTFKIRVNVYANGASLDDEGLANESKAEIKSFSLGGEEIDPSDTDTKLYEATLPEETKSTTVEIETESEYASVKIEKTDSNYNSSTSMNTGSIARMSTRRTLALENGENYFKITVIAENGTPNPDVYKLHITVEKIYQLYEKKQGDYVAYEGNNGCLKGEQPFVITTNGEVGGNGCLGWNNGQSSTTGFLGACISSSNSFKVYGWRIAYIEGENAYLISAGSPECTSNNVSSLGNEAYIDYANTQARKYCNSDYVDGDCSDNSDSWAMRNIDYNKITKQLYPGTGGGYAFQEIEGATKCDIDNANYLKLEQCGYQSDLIVNGGWYQLAAAYASNSNYGVGNSGAEFGFKAQSSQYGLRPVIKISSSVYVTGGKGTMGEPYTIANH